jgi:hypothetical protein
VPSATGDLLVTAPIPPPNYVQSIHTCTKYSKNTNPWDSTLLPRPMMPCRACACCMGMHAQLQQLSHVTARNPQVQQHAMPQSWCCCSLQAADAVSATEQLQPAAERVCKPAWHGGAQLLCAHQLKGTAHVHGDMQMELAAVHVAGRHQSDRCMCTDTCAQASMHSADA